MINRNTVFAEAHASESRGEAFALAFIIESRGSAPRNTGRMLIRPDGSTVGTVGGGPMEAQVIEEGLQALVEGRSRTVRRNLVPTGKGAAGMECGGTMTVRIDVATAPPRLLLVGGGHVNLAVARTASTLGFAVDVVESRKGFCTRERFPMARALFQNDNLLDAIEDARPDSGTWAIIATHNDDLRALLALMKGNLSYVGMLGSKRKTALAVAALREAGIPEEKISALRAPVGLDIGAETPEEIAVSILAELLQVRSGRDALPLHGMSQNLIVVRGGGDLATGTAWRLKRCGFRVIVLETRQPTVIRRTVAFASALAEGSISVEGVRARRAADPAEAYAILEEGDVPVLADPEGVSISVFRPAAVVDAIIAKKNLGTRKDMAPLVVALGPGFRAGADGDCHAVVETARGHDLGRVIVEGTARENTGTPGVIDGRGADRVLRSPAEGSFEPIASLGSLVTEGQILAKVGTEEIRAPFDGKLRGLLSSGVPVVQGFKVGDIDPRGAEVDENRISDKARAVAGGVVEAVLMLRNRALRPGRRMEDV